MQIVVFSFITTVAPLVAIVVTTLFTAPQLATVQLIRWLAVSPIFWGLVSHCVRAELLADGTPRT